MTTDWGNFENWLNDTGGLSFYLALLGTISLIPILVDFLRLRRRSDLNRFPALLLWVGLILLPIIAVTGSFSYFGPGALLTLTSAFSLFAGVVILRWTHRTERFPAILVWVGLSLLPVILVVPFVTWWYFPSPGAILTSISAFSLFAGVVILRWTHRTERFPAILVWVGLSLSPIILFESFVPWTYFFSVGAIWMFAFAVPLFAGLIMLAIAKANAVGTLLSDNNRGPDETR